MSSARLGHRPAILPRDSFTHIQRRGVNYEKRVVRDLVGCYPEYFIIHGQWIYKGNSFCQPDIILIPHKGPILVLEVKLTHKRGVEKKMRDLYVPLVEETFPGKSVACGQVFRNADGTEAPFDLELFKIFTHHQYGEVQWR